MEIDFLEREERTMLTKAQKGHNDARLKDHQVKHYLFQAIDRRTAKIVWDSMKQNFGRNMSIDELQSSLVVHEQKFRRSNINGEEKVLKVKGRTKISNRGRGTYRGTGRGRGRSTFNKATVECYRFHDLSHFQYECPKMNKKLNYAQLEGEDEMLLMAHMERHEAKRSDAWF